MTPEEKEAMRNSMDGYQHVPLQSVEPIAIRFEEATPLAPRALKSCAEMGYEDIELTEEEVTEWERLMRTGEARPRHPITTDHIILESPTDVPEDAMLLPDGQLAAMEQLRQAGKGQKRVEVSPGVVEFEDGYDGDEPLTPEQGAELRELQARLTPERLDALLKQYPTPPEFWTSDYDYDTT